MIRFFSRPRRERGAIAIIVGALAIVLFGVAALGVDIASQVNRKHLVKNQLDAAATAAAYYLDTDTTGIRDAATNAITYYAKNGHGTLDPSKIDFWCVVARKLNTDNVTPATPAQAAPYQIPTMTQTAGVCNPDALSTTTDWKMSDYQNRVRYDGRVFKMTCNTTMCAIPCALQARPSNNWSPGLSVANNRPITCNTIRVGAEENVPFNFAPVLGVDQGSTGAQIAVACKGACGTVAQNPMNVVVVTDRTTSMSTTDEHAMIQGIKNMMLKMSPEQQYLALGTIGRSSATSRTSFTACTTVQKAGTSTASRGTNNWTYSGDTDSGNASKLWVPLQFFKNYQDSTGALSTSSNIVKALNCLDPNVTSGGNFSNGTYLAAPLKAAARYVLGDRAGMDSAGYNVSSLGGAGRSGRVRNVIIFETDGQPFELYTKSTSDPSQNFCGVSTSLTTTASGCGNGYDVFSDFQRATVGTPSTSSICPSGTKPYSGAATCATSYTGTQTCTTSTDTIANSICWGLTTTKPTCSSGTYYNTNVSESSCLTRTNPTVKNGKNTCGTGYTLDGSYCYKATATPAPACSSGLTFGAKDGSTYGCWANHGAPTTPTYTIGYKNTSTTTTYTGGQNACKNFADVANAFKAADPDNLIITVGYNLNNSTLCGDNNYVWNDNDKVKDVAGGTTYLSKVTTPSGTQITDGSCVSGNGTQASPYVLLTTCKQNVVLNYTTNVIVQGSGNSAVPDVLAGAAGGQGIDASTNSNDCSSTTGRTAENSDGDFFFCAASGDDMGSIFVTALSQVSSGIKLINLPH
jgi:hypothetical protein